MLKKIFEISCKYATFLTSKKEVGKTSIFENIKLKLHYKICDGCQLFDDQTKFIGKKAKHTHDHINIVLRLEKKQEIIAMIKALKTAFFTFVKII